MIIFPVPIAIEWPAGYAVCRVPGGWHLSDEGEPLAMDEASATARAEFDRLHGCEALIVAVFEEEG